MKDFNQDLFELLEELNKLIDKWRSEEHRAELWAGSEVCANDLKNLVVKTTQEKL